MTDILSNYVDHVLRPSKQQIDFLGSKLRAIKQVIEHNADELSLDQVRPGGSFTKGTMLKYRPEADLVLAFRKAGLQGMSHRSLMRKVHQTVKTQFPEASVELGRRIAITMNFRTGADESYAIDLVPSLEVNSPLQVSAVRDSDAYQGITTVWHGRYVRQQANRFAQYRDLVMLLKDWNNEHETTFKSFHLELLVASAVEYQQMDSQNSPAENLFECFREVAAFTDGSPVFPIGWKYFDPDTGLDQFNNEVIMVDPANPQENLASQFSEDAINETRSLAHRAMSLLAQGRYADVLDPSGTQREFWIRHHISV